MVLRDVDGVRLNVLDEGEGQPVLFLHGLGGSWRDWEPQLDHLCDRYRCVVVEHRGHGRSERTDARYSTALFAADALAACRQLGVTHAHVVGLSMGGQIAQSLALAEPAFVDTLVLCDTGAWMPERMADGLRQIAEAVRAHGFVTARTVPTSTPGAWSQHTLDRNPRLVRSNRRDAESTDPEAWARGAYAVAEHDTRADLGRISAPPLLVWGEEDALIRMEPASRPLLAGLPDARLVAIPNAGHLPQLEQPEAFHAALTTFFGEHAPTGAAAGG